MSLLIAREESQGLLVVHVSGVLGVVGLEELRGACRGAARLRIDLSELLTADEAATRLLAAMRDAGAELVSVPPYIDLLIRAREAGRASPTPPPLPEALRTNPRR